MPFGQLLRCLLIPLVLCTSSRAASGSATPGAPVSAAAAVLALEPLSVVFVTPEAVLRENYPSPATLAAWLKPVLAVCDAAVAAEPSHPDLLVQISLRPYAPPSFEIAGNPPLNGTFVTALGARLAALPDHRPPLCQVCVRVQTPGNTDNPLAEAAAFTPRLLPPDEAALNRFIAADLPTQYRELRAWARTQALPLLAHHAANVDPQFTGVVATGSALAALAPDTPIAVEQLTFRRADFWRGLMETAPGDPLISALPAVLHTAAGEIDQASTQLSLVLSFSRDGPLGRQILNELAARIGPFRRQLTAEMERGIALHDQGEFNKAIACYQGVLTAYPNSAWARYELFFSTVTRDGLDSKKKVKRANKLWDQIAPEIYRCNPLYDSQFGAVRGHSVGAMLDRLVLHRLANKPPEKFGEKIGCFADAALRLECYGPAAQLYWAALGTKHDYMGLSMRDDQPVPLSKEDLLARYLYCLEKLGVPGWKGEFEGDFSASFRQLDASLAAHRGQ
jgi:tetratricopeptide (TPR) repeat protein